MRKKTSYLDSINEGRQRRPRTSLDDLDRTLRGLEEKIGGASDKSHYRHESAGSRDLASKFRNLATESDLPSGGNQARQAGDGMPSASSFKTLAQDIEFARMQEKNVAAVESIAIELKELRDELQNKMTSGLHREFDALRSDIAETYRAAQSGYDANDLSGEIQRLSDSVRSLSQRSENGGINLLRAELDEVKHALGALTAAQSGHDKINLSDDIQRLTENVRSLSQRSDDSGIDMLRAELEEVKRALGALAREDSIQQMSQRWEEIDRQWSPGPNAPDLAADPEFRALADRLEDIGAAVKALPSSLPMESLESKLQVLASAVEHLTQKQDPVSTQHYEMIEQRLDEITRAIVASSVSVQAAVPNTEPLERIEARITSLAQQIDELMEVQPNADLLDRISGLAERVENIAQNSGSSPDAVERLAAQISDLASKVDAGALQSEPTSALRDLEERYEHLVAVLERHQDTNEQQGRALIEDLETRLDAVAKNSSARESNPGESDAIIRAMDARFNELALHFESTVNRKSDEAGLQNLEARLADITKRLDSTAPAASSINADLISNLESQVANLTSYLERPDTVIPEQADLSPRIQEIEHSLASTREQILTAAREAAEQAILSLPTGPADDQAAAALAKDLKSLEELTRTSDERNNRTFEAIHDTLLKVVDRLGSLEAASMQLQTGGGEQKAHVSQPVPELSNAPAIEPSHADFGMENQNVDAQYQDGVGSSTPAEAAAWAAETGAEEPLEVEQHGAGSTKKSMLGGLTRALKGRTAPPEMTAEADGLPAQSAEQATGEEDQSYDANTPLEPGSGAPDLGSIMARVKEEKNGGAPGQGVDPAKSDFIAAARRAAQAAAAEAESNRIRTETGRSSARFNVMGALQKKRKPILIGASVLLIALAGVQLGKAFLGGSEPAEVAVTAPAADEEAKPVEMTADPTLDENQPTAEIEANPAVRVVETTEPPAPLPAEVKPIDAGSAALNENADVPAEPAIEKSTNNEITVAAAPKATIAAVPVEAGPVALREAAQAGDAKALYELGNRYAEGRGVKSDLAEAAKWYQASADLGFAPAQYRIGNFHEKGLGLERDPTQAMTWYQLAAEQGNASAMHNLAVLFAMGAGGQPDNEAAARWFEKAAELGVKDSQFNLGILSAKGVGMEQDLEASYKWFALAAKTGDKDAGSKRDEIANALRPEQLSKARASVELWKAKPIDEAVNSVVVPAEWKEDGAKTAGVDVKKAVRNIQAILNNNGYSAGPADGVMGAKTKAAIAAFQKDNGMAATGEVDEALVKALLSKNQ
ncbi:MAG: peptidoglycan-binding protein [Rhizobiaceae bacterium]